MSNPTATTTTTATPRHRHATTDAFRLSFRQDAGIQSRRTQTCPPPPNHHPTATITTITATVTTITATVTTITATITATATTPMTTLAIDIYGTLIDTAGITTALHTHITAINAPTPAAAFAEEWRRKQLEYTFRYGLMATYQNFRTCTRQALDHTCAHLQTDLPAAARADLMARYLTLPAFPDVAAALHTLTRAAIRCYAFSNGLPEDLETLLTHADIRRHLAGVISVHDLATFKPNPAVYHHFLAQSGASPSQTWLISANPFDICGAAAVGMQTYWLQRNPAIHFDPWQHTPTKTAASLTEIAHHFTAVA